MKEEILIEEIIEIVHKIAGHEFKWSSQKKDALIVIRNKIMEFKGEDSALGNVVIYLNGFIQGIQSSK